MSEHLPQQDPELEQGELVLDRVKIVRLMQELKIDIELEDFDGLDDTDVLGAIAANAAVFDFDPEEVVRYVTPTEERKD